MQMKDFSEKNGFIKYIIKTKRVKHILLFLVIFFLIFANIIVVIQAYSFSHFKENVKPIPRDLDIATSDIIKMFFCGVDLLRPKAIQYPSVKYKEFDIPISENKKLNAWSISTDSINKGMVILYHGYMDEKSKMLPYAYSILDMGYEVVLIDFEGSGKSSGSRTTIGHHEAENVKVSVDYIKYVLHKQKIFLLGFSMGSVAIFKAQHDYTMPIDGIIAEASYGNMLETIETRGEIAGLGNASKISASVFLFWFGLINDLDAFSANPEEYVKTITIPTLIQCGGKDQYIPVTETYRIFNNLSSKNKKIKIYEDCAHEMYNLKYTEEWKETVQNFLDNI